MIKSQIRKFLGVPVSRLLNYKLGYQKGLESAVLLRRGKSEKSVYVEVFERNVIFILVMMAYMFSAFTYYSGIAQLCVQPYL